MIQKTAADYRHAGHPYTLAAIRANLGAGPKQARDILAEIRRQEAAVVQRQQRRRRTHGWPRRKQADDPGAALPTGRIEHRLWRRTSDEVRAGLAWTGQAAGGVTIEVAFGAASITIRKSANRNVYRGQFRGWAATELDIRVQVPREWLRTVERSGLAVVDGLLTLEARHLDRVGDVDLYAAAWVERGRGYSATVERGVLAISGAVSYHGADAAGALRGIARKREGATAAPPRLPVRKHPDLRVSLADVRKVGACESGIRSWCHAAGMSDALERGWATVAELAPAYERMPARELRAAVMLAARSAGAAS
jgi:hypothetical protein